MEAIFEMFNKIYPMGSELQNYIMKNTKRRKLNKKNPGKQQAFKSAQNSYVTQTSVAQGVSDATAGAFKETFNAAKKALGNNNNTSSKTVQLPNLQMLMMPAVDNTRVVRPIFINYSEKICRV